MSHHKKQDQALDYTQLQQKKQDLVHCNNSFGMLLSSMESYLIKSNYNMSVLFGYYNHFNDISWKTKEEIKAQLYIDLMGYKIQKSAYFKKYGEIYQPDYPPISDICKIVKQWKQKAGKREEKELCEEILDLINDKNNKPLSYYQEMVENMDSPSNSDPVKSLKMSNQIHDIMDNRDAKIRNEIQKNPNAKFGLQIGKQPGTSEFSNLPKDLDRKKIDQMQKSLEDNIINQMNIIIQIIDKYTKTQRLEVNSLNINIKNAQKVIEEYYQKYNINVYINNLNYMMSICRDENKSSIEYAKNFFSIIEQIKYR